MINRDFNVVMRSTDTNNCGETEEAVPPFLPPSHTHVSLKSAELHVDPVSHTHAGVYRPLAQIHHPRLKDNETAYFLSIHRLMEAFRVI